MMHVRDLGHDPCHDHAINGQEIPNIMTALGIVELLFGGRGSHEQQKAAAATTGGSR